MLVTWMLLLLLLLLAHLEQLEALLCQCRQVGIAGRKQLQQHSHSSSMLW
jgi:hypothetical protein